METAELILAIYGAVQIIVRATPTKKDDKLLAKIQGILDVLFVSKFKK